MNAALLLEYYARITEAPDAITRLRRFVLDLAVRGKLVEQGAGDESASKLLERIAAKKARLVEAGSVRDRAELPKVMPQDAPYSLPSGWMWVRFANIVEFYAGRTPARNDLSYWNTGHHAWVSISDIKDGGVIQQTKETVSDVAQASVFKSEPESVGTIVMSFKLTIGKIARLGVPAFHNEAIISIHPYLQALDGYLFMALPELARTGDTKGAIKGATLNRDSLSNILVPLPPLAEQHRIVAKVNELMALCDQLEAARAERETARDTFTLSTVAKLKTPNAETFGQDARFALANLPPLTTRPDQIKQLRQTILNLAMRGNLVEQDAADEPAAVLLKRTSDDIESYCSANRVGRAKPEPLAEHTAPFSAPSGWSWVRLCQLFRVVTDGDHQPPPRADEGIAFLTIGNVTTGRLDFDGCRLVPESYFRALPAYRTPTKGDILYTVVGATFGRPALVDSEREFCVQRHIAILKPAKTMEIRFLLLLLASPLVYEQAAGSTTGTAQPTIALRPLRNFAVPVPPLAEQRRIVAKVDELMALCDQLEAGLTTGEQTRSRLLEAVLHNALEPA